MNKRKLPDFLIGIEWNKKKSQKWLKNYPYLRSNLNQLQRIFKQTYEKVSFIVNWFKRLYWIISVSHIKISFQSAYTTFRYIQSLFFDLNQIRLKIDLLDIKIQKTCTEIQNKAVNFEEINFKEQIDQLEEKLNNIRFYCDKSVLIFKDLETNTNLKFNCDHIKVAGPQLSKMKYTPVENDNQLKQVKEKHKHHFYKQNPEVLLLNYEYSKEIPNACFLKYLETETCNEYKHSLFENISNLILYNIPIYENIKIKYFHMNQIILSNQKVLNLLNRFSYQMKSSKQIIFNDLFADDDYNLIISLPCYFPKFPNSFLSKDLTGLIMKYLLKIEILSKHAIEFTELT